MIKVFRRGWGGSAGLAVAEAEDDLSKLQQEMKGLANQIDAHHREDDARRERSQGSRDQNDATDGVSRRRTVERKLGSRLRVARRGRWVRVGSAVFRVLRGELALLSFWNSNSLADEFQAMF